MSWTKRSRESVLITMDFAGLAPFNDTIVSQGVDIEVDSGVDWNITAMLSGKPMFNGTLMMQMVVGGVSGNIYRLSYFMKTSSGVIRQLSGYLVIMPDPVTADEIVNPDIALSLPDPIDTPYGGLN